MTTLTLTLGDDDLSRIADAVVSRLDDRPKRQWLDVEAASSYTSLSKGAIRTAFHRGRLKGHKGESGRVMFRVEDLDAYLGGAET